MSSSSFNSGYDIEENAVSGRAPEVQQNWLSRFLRIKPASQVLCFRIGRGKVRNDLVRLLRDWKRFGVRDVAFDREANSITARIDKTNRKFPPSLLYVIFANHIVPTDLKIKPVSIVIEIFAILNDGRRANLCLARFTQTRGAATSFRKVVDIVEDVCRGRGMLVEDEEQKRAMCEILG